jgi:hypothetical protein
VRRWLVASLALLVAAAAIFVLLSSPDPLVERAPDHGEIDDESRAKLREALREERGD